MANCRGCDPHSCGRGTGSVVNKGKGTKAGSDGGEKQIAAERKNTQGPAWKKKAEQEK